MQINKAAILPGELPYLAAYIENILELDTRTAYIKWLSEQGDIPRASFLSDLSREFAQLGNFFSPNTQGIPNFWAEMVGVSHLFALRQSAGGLSDEEISDIRDHLFKWVRPAITFEYSMMGKEPDIGSSYFWGSPDLDSDTPWPKRGDCLHWDDDDCGLSGDLPCAFIGQINLADFAGTLIGKTLPATGLLSFFAHTETNELGVMSVKTIYTKSLTNLQRQTQSARQNSDADNAPHPAYKIHAREILTFPETCDSPWADEFVESGYNGRFYDTYESVRQANNANKIGMLGYHQATTGGDPSPDKNHMRLINIRVTPDAGCIHLSISNEDLKAERFEQAKYVWVDWDG